jgi:hypothetical protein
VGEHHVFEHDHGQAQTRRNRGGEQKLPSAQLGRSPGRPRMDRQHHDRREQPDVGSGKPGDPGYPGQHEPQQRQIRRTDHGPGGIKPAADKVPCRDGPAFDLLAQQFGVLFREPYTTSVATTATTSASVGNLPPAASRIAAVTIAP